MSEQSTIALPGNLQPIKIHIEDNPVEENPVEENPVEDNVIEMILTKYVKITINNDDTLPFINMCRKFISTKYNKLIMSILKNNLLKGNNYESQSDTIMKVLTDINDHKNIIKDEIHTYLEQALIDILFNNEDYDDIKNDVSEPSYATNEKILIYIGQSESPTIIDIYISYIQSNESHRINYSQLMRHLYSSDLLIFKDFFMKVGQKMIDNKMIEDKMIGWLASKGLQAMIYNICWDDDNEDNDKMHQSIDQFDNLIDWIFTLGGKKIDWFFNSTLKYLAHKDDMGSAKFCVLNVYYFVKKICKYIESEESFACSDSLTCYLQLTVPMTENVKPILEPCLGSGSELKLDELEINNISSHQRKRKLKNCNNNVVNNILVFLCSETDPHYSFHEIVEYILKKFEIDENVLMTCVDFCYKECWHDKIYVPMILCDVVKTIYNMYPEVSDYISNSANSFYREIDVYAHEDMCRESMIAHYIWLVDNKIISRKNVCERFMGKTNDECSCMICVNDTCWKLKKCSHPICKECFVTIIYFYGKTHEPDNNYCEHCKLLNTHKDLD